MHGWACLLFIGVSITSCLNTKRRRSDRSYLEVSVVGGVDELSEFLLLVLADVEVELVTLETVPIVNEGFLVLELLDAKYIKMRCLALSTPHAWVPNEKRGGANLHGLLALEFLFNGLVTLTWVVLVLELTQ